MSSEALNPSTRLPRTAAVSDAVPRTGALNRPLTSYYLVLGCTGLLLALGLVMVLSASSVASYKTYGSSFAIFRQQATWTIIGLPIFWAASRLPTRLYRFSSTFMLMASFALRTDWL